MKNIKVICIVVIVAIVAALAIGGFKYYIDNKSKINPHPEELYSMKNTYLGDASATRKIVELANITPYQDEEIELYTDASPMRLTIKYFVSDRSEHRYIEKGRLNKTAALIFSLIPNADEISMLIFDVHGDIKNAETAFAGSYYNRNLLHEREGMSAITAEYIKGATKDFDAYKEYYYTVMNAEEPKRNTAFLDAMYEYIGDDCEIVANSGIGADIVIDDDFLLSDDCKEIEEALNLNGTGVNFAEYPPKGSAIRLEKYDIRNFKTGEVRKCAVAYYSDTEDGLIMLAQKFLDEVSDLQTIREQIIKRN